MFRRSYKVKGEDVNDFMVMQNFAYLSYSSKIIEAFLLEKGLSQFKLNTQKIGWQKTNDQLTNKKYLMFTESFTVSLYFVPVEKGEITATLKFYNASDELCALLNTELSWFDYNEWKVISPPKRIAKYFFDKKNFYRKAV